MIIGTIAKILGAMYSNTRPGEIAAGAAMGVWIACIPASSPLFWLLFLLIFFVKVHQAIALLGLALGSLIAPIIAPALHSLGLMVLTGAYPFWESVFSNSWMAVSRLNNTLVMGGLLGGLLLSIPVYLLVRSLIPVFREKIIPGIAAHPITQKIYKLPLIGTLLRTAQKWHSVYQKARG